MQAID